MELSEDILRLIEAAKFASANLQEEVGKLERAGNIQCAQEKEREIEVINISIFLLEGNCELTQAQIDSFVKNIACFVDPELASCPTEQGVGFWAVEQSPIGCPVNTVGGANENGLIGEFTEDEFTIDEHTINIEP